MGYRVVVADPPWRFDDSLPGTGRGAAKHYSCMSMPDIEALATRSPLTDVEDDAVLFLWRVGCMQPEALRLVEAWGFEPPTSEVVWVKTTKAGRPHIGMGRTVRNAHEVALLCRRGRPRVLSRSVPSVLMAPRGRHSEKPQSFFDMVQQLYPGPYLEMFARVRRPGWDAWGDEV